MTDNRNLLTVTAAEKQELERWAQSRTLPAGDVFRARLILALAEGQSYRQIQSSLRTSAATNVIARGVFTSVADLARKLRKYIRAYAKLPKPFRWTYTDPNRRIRTYEITGTAY